MSKKERLDKVLANMGYGSRKDVKKINQIWQGKSQRYCDFKWGN